MTKTVGWGLIGASNVAREWIIDAIRAQPDNEIVTVLSSDNDRAANYAAENNIPHHCTQLEALLSDDRIDAVYISTTNELHKQQALAAAAAGKHILCEKPLALSLNDARDMIDACRRAGVIMATNHHLRNAATHHEIRRMLRDNVIGKPLFIRVFHANYLPPHLQGWRVNNAGGGVILDSTIHDIDTLRFLLDAEPVSVTAMTQSALFTAGDQEDGVMAIVRFDNGAIAQIHGAYSVKVAPGGIEIYSTDKAIVARNVMSQRAIGQVFLRDAEGEHEIPIVHENLYHRALRAFNKALRKEGEPAATGEDGLRSLAVALAIKEAAQTGCQREVQYA
ncbi:Gfo/Idh/MocA family protein [Beijerinckia indica]|uniref:Oxidoreductase domain protein n=1 Tax=Beijerinckia indica subsp. indica (strain ATCC 9039 / DSM 1715 / NCIMB 8712) TaxID=395963 RepID=B2IFR5_BEII9|nr:Gfo/Idh/MocA family oxidoreductase [Beijerinckia indica]ACB94276.1 oxidoreductase domain protein [Beijerinckia indica subsp. indica ATCC 9039]